MTSSHTTRYLRPGRTMDVFNAAVAALARAGVSLLGSRELRVLGRKSGDWRTTPVNLLVVDGERFLVAPRGRPSGSATSEWPAAAVCDWAGGSKSSARSNWPIRT